MLQLIAEARSENVALQAVCAGLLAEVAYLSGNDREGKLAQMLSGLQGMAHGLALLARSEQIDTQIVTQTIERICTMAEAALPPRNRPSET